MSNLIVQQDIVSLLDGWIEAERNGVEFPVPFESAYQMAGYTRKDNAKRSLPKSAQGILYLISRIQTKGRPVEQISLNIAGLEHMCLMADTPEGHEIREYFRDARSKWELTKQVAPKVADEVEILHLQIQLENARMAANSSEKALLDTRHLIIATTPKAIADRILGVKEVVETEYVDRTILPSGQVNEGIGITYIQKRYGFRSTKEAWNVLESVGCGKNSDIWKTQLRAVESQVIDRSILGDLDALIQDASRQRNLGEGLRFAD